MAPRIHFLHSLRIRGATIRVEKIGVLAYFGIFLQILSQLKKTSKNLNARIILVLDAAFVSNLTFLVLLSAEISFGKKSPAHLHLYTDTQLILQPQSLSAPHRGINAHETHYLLACLKCMHVNLGRLFSILWFRL